MNVPYRESLTNVFAERETEEGRERIRKEDDDEEEECEGRSSL